MAPDATACTHAQPMRLAAAPRHVAMCRYSSLNDPDREALSGRQRSFRDRGCGAG